MEVKKVGYKDVLKVNNEIVAYGGCLNLLMDYRDSRFRNLSVLDVDGDSNFRDNCSIGFVYDLRDANNHRLGDTIVYTNIDGDELVIGKLSEDERKAIEYWFISYGLEVIEKADVLDYLPKEDFEEEYYSLPKLY